MQARQVHRDHGVGHHEYDPFFLMSSAWHEQYFLGRACSHCKPLATLTSLTLSYLRADVCLPPHGRDSSGKLAAHLISGGYPLGDDQLLKDVHPVMGRQSEADFHQDVDEGKLLFFTAGM